MAGFFDYILGRDEYASDAPLDPTTGLRPADRRQAGINTLANVSQALMQIGAARNPTRSRCRMGHVPNSRCYWSNVPRCADKGTQSAAARAGLA